MALRLVTVAAVLALLVGFGGSSCPPKDLCLGQQPGQSQPASVSALLQELSTRYCGCSRVLGNVIVSLGSLAANGISSENFTFLSNIVEITGYLEISGLILSDRIILPELKVIQGRALRNGRGLFVANVTAPVGVLMPKLSEVVRGDAYFSGVTGQCSYSTVNWNDVLNSGKLVTGSTASCEAPTGDCSECESGFCWNPSGASGEKMCQMLTRTTCPGGEESSRSYKLTNGTSLFCDPSCVGGCDGVTNNNCFACRSYSSSGRCVHTCPSRVVYDEGNHTVQANPQAMLRADYFCVNQCPDGLFSKDGDCVLDCGSGLVGQNGMCVPPPAPQLIECTSSLDLLDALSATNYQQFSGCNIVNGHIVINNLISTAISLNSMVTMDTVTSALGSIQEIRGTLFINNYNMPSLPFLKNVRHIGSTNPSDLIDASTLPDSFGTDRLAVYIQGNMNLRSIDLSTLESIPGGDVILDNNEQLCFVGNFSHYTVDPSSQVVALGLNPHKDVDDCAADNDLCDSQCDPSGHCWGKMSNQCVRCRNFRDPSSNNCVEDCSAITSTFANTTTMTCEPCHMGCLKCSGPLSGDCMVCQNYSIPGVEVNQSMLCVSECPSGYYSSGSTCMKCNNSCGGEECTGPSPMLGVGGCAACRLVKESNGQYECLVEVPSGHYGTALPSSNCRAPAGTIVYRLCNETCGECTGPAPTQCTSCKDPNFVINNDTKFCESACNDQMYLNHSTMKCEMCNGLCDGCTGPTDEDCILCRNVKKGDKCVDRCSTQETTVDGNCTLQPSTNSPTTPPSSATSPGGSVISPVSEKVIISVAVAVPVVLVLVVIILILGIVTVFRCKRSKNRIKLSSLASSPSQTDRRSRISEIPLTGMFFFIPEGELHAGEKVKEGQFSDIYQGTWTQWDDSEMTVAIKQMKNSLDLSTEDSAITDLRSVVSLNYPYLVKVHGICANGSIRIVTDYIEHGGLGLYLAENASYITCEDVMRFMVQVSGAMEYLEVQRIPHGSLSARNVLVASKDNVKVSDIGMLSVVQQGNKDTRNVMAPIRWLAPECIRNNITPSLKSDVWSFGVTMWEILTYGQYPYSELNSPGEVIYQIMSMQTRLPQTGNCTDELFDVISQCWALSENQRPTFKRLDALLSQMSEYPKNYIIADQLLTKCVFRERRPAYEEFYPGDLLNLMGSPDSGVDSPGAAELKEKSERLV